MTKDNIEEVKTRLMLAKDPWEIFTLGNEALSICFYWRPSEATSLALQFIQNVFSQCAKHGITEGQYKWLFSLSATSYWPQLIKSHLFLAWKENIEIKKDPPLSHYEGKAWSNIAEASEQFFRNIISENEELKPAYFLMRGYDGCVQNEQAEIGYRWLRSFSKLPLWPTLFSLESSTRLEFGPWIDRIFTRGMQIYGKTESISLPAFDNTGRDPAFWTVPRDKFKDLPQICEKLFSDIKEWELSTENSFLGGSRLLFMLNRTRLNHQNTSKECLVNNAAGFDLVFLPSIIEEKNYKKTLLYSVAETEELTIKRIVLGTAPEE